MEIINSITEQDSSIGKDIVSIFLSIILLLIGISITSTFADGVWASVINVLFLSLSIYFLCQRISLSCFVGDKIVPFIFIISSLTLFCVIFSSQVLFHDHILNPSSDISLHYEHNWMYDNVIAIADHIRNGDRLAIIWDSLSLRQYTYLFTYSSLPFIVGGDNVTNICIWNALHLAIIAILSVKIAIKAGVEDEELLFMILIIAALQPALNALYIYDRDIVGQAVLMLGVYIFMGVYKQPALCLCTLPLYGALFYSFRMQYALIAVAMCIWSYLFSKQREGFYYIGLLLLIAAGSYFLSVIDFTSTAEDLNINHYMDNVADGRNLSIVRTILIGLIGYFPWTNLFDDIHWTYHLWICFQAAMDLTIWYYVIKSNKSNFSTFVSNPLLFLGLLLTSFAFISVGHTKYFCVGVPLFLIGIININISKILTTYLIMVFCLSLASVVYSL